MQVYATESSACPNLWSSISAPSSQLSYWSAPWQMLSVGYPCKKSHIQNNSHHSGYQRSQTDHGQARVGLNTHNVSKWQTYQQSLNKSLGHDSHYMPGRPSSQFGSGTDGIQVMNIRRRYSIRQWRQQIPCPFCLITGIKHFFQCFNSHNKKSPYNYRS